MNNQSTFHNFFTQFNGVKIYNYSDQLITV